MLSYILKIPLPSGESEMIDSLWSLFPKETLMYRKILPRFEKLYRDHGVDITFGPKYYDLPRNDNIDDNVLLLEDLSQRGFGLQNRLEGLNLKYTENVLEKLAAFHAVSARYVEVYGPYEVMFEQHMFSEETRPLYENVKINYFYDYAKTYKDHEKYIDLLVTIQDNFKLYSIFQLKFKHFQPNVLDNYLDKCIAASSIDFGEFNVLNHGDFWLNNVLFQNCSENQKLETYFIDFQLCKYGSPTLDLYMFLLSGISLDIKISHFDYFIKFYHDNLLKYLQILKYNGKPPTLKELQLMLLKYGYMGRYYYYILFIIGSNLFTFPLLLQLSPRYSIAFRCVCMNRKTKPNVILIV